MTYTSYQADVIHAARGRSRFSKFFRTLLDAHIEARMKAVRRELRSRGIEIEPAGPVRAVSPTPRLERAAPRSLDAGSERTESGAKQAGAFAPLRSVRRFCALVGEIYVETLALRREMKRRYPHLDL